MWLALSNVHDLMVSGRLADGTDLGRSLEAHRSHNRLEPPEDIDRR
jgi:hypothetical protein